MQQLIPDIILGSDDTDQSRGQEMLCLRPRARDMGWWLGHIIMGTRGHSTPALG